MSALSARLDGRRWGTGNAGNAGGAVGLSLPIGLCAGGILFGALAGYLGTHNHLKYVFLTPILLLARELWRRPHLGPAALLGGALMSEQTTSPTIPWTSKIPFFTALGPGHLQGADMLVLLVAASCWVHREELKLDWRPRSHVTLALTAVLGCVVFGIAVGHLHGGVLRESLMEARPYVYLASTYFLTSVLLAKREALISLLWTFVVCCGLKAAQGIYVYSKHRHDFPRPESFIGHEVSYFFVLYVVLVLALWLFNERGKLRRVATRLLPIIIFCAMVNDRRVAWEMLGGAVMTMAVIAYQSVPHRRHVLGKIAIGLALLSAVYFPVMWNRTDSLAQPARAIRSQISPTVRDASSDLYRVQENANLELNIKQGGVLGRGFGVKIDYALPITDISSIDPLITYIPHDGILYVMMRMGLLGAIALWSLIAAGIIAGCRLAKSRDSLIAVIGTLMACGLVAYALMGAVDQGLFWYRIAFVTGTLLGLGEAARRIQRTQPTPAQAPPRHLPRQIVVLVKRVRSS